MLPRLLIGRLGVEQACRGIGIQCPSPEVVEETAYPFVGNGMIRSSHVEGERGQRSAIGEAHLDIRAGQRDVHPRGISQVCFGSKREDNCQHLGLPERERCRPPVTRDLVDTGNPLG